MPTVTKSFVSMLLTCVVALGCGSSQSVPEAPTETEPTPEPGAQPSPGPTERAAERPELTAEACEASGGTVVGDIGDGAIHRADYRCPNGAEPSGSIRASEGGPMAVEGAVCCPK
jgi:hypothetical protein